MKRIVVLASALALAGLLLGVAGLTTALGPVANAEAASELEVQSFTPSSSGATWVVRQLVSDTSVDYPVVSADGDYVSWSSYNSVLLLNLQAGKATEIFSTVGRAFPPRVSGKYVVWSASDYFRGPSRAYVYDTETRKTVQLPHAASEFDIDGNRVVWTADEGVYLHDCVGGGNSLIGPGGYGTPQILGRYVVWEGLTDPEQLDWDSREIFLYDLQTKQVRQLTSNALGDSDPQLGDGYVVWQRGENADIDSTEICLYSLDSRQTTELTHDQAYDCYARMSGDVVAWIKSIGDGYDGMEIYLYEVQTQETTRLTENDFSDCWPAIGDHLVVWSGGHYPDDPDGLGHDLYVYDMDSGDISRISRGCSDQPEVAISDGRLFWMEGSGDGFGVFVATPSGSFFDVSVSPYRTAIEELAGRGIISGYGDGTFGPGNVVMRKHFAKMIVGVMDLPVSEDDWQDGNAPFTDCGKDELDDTYPHDYIAVAKAHGLTLGTTGTTFSPDTNISRAQVATMVVRAAANSSIALDPVGADYAGVFQNYSNATHGDNVKLAEYNGLLGGLVTSGNAIAWMDGKATRGEVAQILYNLMMR